MSVDDMVVLDDSDDTNLASGLAGHDSGVRFSRVRTKDNEANNSMSYFSHGTRDEGLTAVPDGKTRLTPQAGPASSITTPRSCLSVDSEAEAPSQTLPPTSRGRNSPTISQRPLKLILVDSRRFCKTRRKRPHFLGISDKTSESFLLESPLHQCTCSSHPTLALPSNIARDCDSCKENSDDEYDDTIHAPAIRRKARKRLRKERGSAAGQEDKEMTSKKHAKLTSADLEIISGSSPTSPRNAKLTPSQSLDKALDRLDWNAATTALAGIQVQCQRLLADTEALKIPGARQKIQQGVADSLRAYWTQLLKQSLADIS